MISRRSLINMPSKQIILVDHNEIDQAVDGITDASVIEIVDHHKLGTIETMSPISVRNQPVGCTATIIYQIFVENAVDIPENIAGLLCGAILSDTLLYRSPTCTPEDRAAAEALADIAHIKTHELAQPCSPPEATFTQNLRRRFSTRISNALPQAASLSA